ncbi:hypothetical protein NBH08_04540 [Faecalicatena sp. BF-R-105]|nr:hypothetical protein [Faecalicatena sp. BF-R-105]
MVTEPSVGEAEIAGKLMVNNDGKRFTLPDIISEKSTTIGRGLFCQKSFFIQKTLTSFFAQRKIRIVSLPRLTSTDAFTFL